MIAAAAAVGFAWAAYTIGVWGYCLVKGYDVRARDLFRPVWPGHATGTQPQAPQQGNGAGTITGHPVNPANPGLG